MVYRGLSSDAYAFCENCLFYNNVIQMMGAGSSGKIEFKNSKVYATLNSGNQINVNHHCGLEGGRGVSGGLCAPHYVFNNVNFGNNEPLFYTVAYDGGLYLPTDVLIFYNEYIYYDTCAVHPTFNPSSNKQGYSYCTYVLTKSWFIYHTIS